MYQIIFINMKVEFEIHGYMVDYYLRGKLIGHVKLDEPDREVLGYTGRKTEILNREVQLSNTKIIRSGVEVVTECIPICGKIKGSHNEKLNILFNSRIFYNG